MNQTTPFTHSTQTFQFLSVLNYINTLSDIFYDQNLLEQNEKFQEFSIINAYFYYINRTNDKGIAKRRLAQKLLQGSDFYGGNQNETLDMEYIDATFEYIISNIVFADYGNVYGYLAKIVYLSNNLTLSFLKQKMLEDLTNLKYFNPDGTMSKLSLLSSVRIRDDFLWPLFPQPERDPNVTDVDFIYAQAGLIFAHSAQLNFTNMSFHDYIIVAQTLELTVQQNTTDKSLLNVFTLPALLFRASKKAEKFDQQFLAESVKDGQFLAETLDTLFSYLNETLWRIGQTERESNPLYQFSTAMSEYKNRTQLAEDLLRHRCHLKNESEYESAIDRYKLYASSSKCPNNDSIPLPNVDEIYQHQINQIREKYRILLDIMIRDVFHEAKLVELINSTSTKVFESQVVPIPVYCFPSPCPPYQPRLNPNIYLFALRRPDGNFHYALIISRDKLTLLSYNSDPVEFLNRVGLSQGTNLEISAAASILKQTFETFETFVDRLARLKAKEFGIKLHAAGYEKTFKEKALDAVLALIPFYNCVRFAMAGDNVGATFSCIGDIVSWIPFGGQLMQLGGRLGNVALNHLLMAAGVSIRTFAARQAISVSLRVGLYEATSGIGGMIKEVILTKDMLKSLSLGFVRAVDPGFEIVGRLHWKAGAMLGELFKKTWTTAAKKFSSSGVNFAKYEVIWRQLTKTGRHSADESGMIPVLLGHMDGYEIFRYTYPGGVEPFGPKFVRLPNVNAELRRVVGFNAEVPVVVSRTTKWGKVYYKKLNLKTRDTFGLELELNQNNVLQPVRSSFREHIGIIVREGLSGRGRIFQERMESMKEAVDLISESDLTISPQSIRRIINHYILATEPPLYLQENLGNVMIDFNLINKIDDINPNTLRKYLGEGPLTVDPILNNYLSVPTYKDFALDWIRSRKIHNSYQKFYVQESVKLESWRSSFFLDTVTKYDLEEVKFRITLFYGVNYEEMSSLDLATILDNYDLFFARELVTFPDYFALTVYVEMDFADGLPHVVKKYMKEALFKVVVRQADEDLFDFPKKVFCLEVKTLEEIEQSVYSWKNNPLITHFFQRTSSDETLIDNLAANYLQENNVILVKYEVNLDSQFLAVFLNRLMPDVEENVIILPNVEFHVDDVIRDGDIVVVKMHNTPVLKELCLVNIMNDLKSLQ